MFLGSRLGESSYVKRRCMSAHRPEAYATFYRQLKQVDIMTLTGQHFIAGERRVITAGLLLSSSAVGVRRLIGRKHRFDDFGMFLAEVIQLTRICLKIIQLVAAFFFVTVTNNQFPST